MDGFVERRNEESIKDTVLKHEEIFKQQVQELHRLYKIQKKLMSEVRVKELKMYNSFLATSTPHAVREGKNRFRNSTSTSETSHCSHASALNHSTDVPNSEHTSIHHFSAGKRSHELSNCLGEPLIISEYNFQQLVGGENHASYSNLDLTLSIGCGTDMNKKADWKQSANDSSLLLTSNLNRPDTIQAYTDSSGGFGSVSLKRPHCLLKALSLNRT